MYVALEVASISVVEKCLDIESKCTLRVVANALAYPSSYDMMRSWY